MSRNRFIDFVVGDSLFQPEPERKTLEEVNEAVWTLHDKLQSLIFREYQSQTINQVFELISSAIQSLDEIDSPFQRLKNHIGKPVRLDRSSCDGEIICEGIGILKEVYPIGNCLVEFADHGTYLVIDRDVIPIDDEPSEGSEGDK